MILITGSTTCYSYSYDQNDCRDNTSCNILLYRVKLLGVLVNDFHELDFGLWRKKEPG